MNGDDLIPLRADRIFLREHVRTLDIGAFSEERGAGQRVAFNIIVDVAGGGAGDDVDEIMSYDEILGAIDGEVARARVDLLETLAEGIAARVLAHPKALRVTVGIEKLDRVDGRLGVEVIRTGTGRAQPSGPVLGPVTGPRVWCLAPGAALPDLPEGANIIAVEGGGSASGATGDPARRISLLASEIAAWEMAAQAGLDVIASRTEIAYAVENDANVFWAPQRMVYSAVEGADALPEDFAALCGWLADQVNARALHFVGRAAPAGLSFDGSIEEHT